MANHLRSWLGAAIVAALVAVGWLAWPYPQPERSAGAAASSSAPAPLTTHTVHIGANDTVQAALARSDVPTTDALAIITALQDAGVQMDQIRAGETLLLQRRSDGRVANVAFSPSPWLRFEAHADAEGWTAQRRDIEPVVRTQVRRATIQASLWDAVSDGAMSPQMLLDVTQILEGEIDFGADTRAGDEVRLLIEARYADDVLVDHGRILAAQYVGAERNVTAIAHTGADGRALYYDADGRSLKKAFLRSPLEFTRISSGFTQRRPHPILGGVRPHLAIDYAAPTGTPVWSVADGVVEHAGWRGDNGIQVLVRHKGGFQTYYNHLSRVGKGIRPGVRVRQKQVIGHVGSTGASTGPHLDYRVSLNGRFVNPLDVRFAPGEPLPNEERAAFLESARNYVAQFDQLSAISAPVASK